LIDLAHFSNIYFPRALGKAASVSPYATFRWTCFVQQFQLLFMGRFAALIADSSIKWVTFLSSIRALLLATKV